MPQTRFFKTLRSAAGVLALCAWLGCKKEAPPEPAPAPAPAPPRPRPRR